MKTTRYIVKAAALASLVVGGFTLLAGDIPTGKGGAGQLLGKMAPVDSPHPDAVVMSCPHCKDQVTVRTDYTARGANKPKVAVTTHLCDECSTKLTRVGHGKQAVTVREHTCAKCLKGS